MSGQMKSWSLPSSFRVNVEPHVDWKWKATGSLGFVRWWMFTSPVVRESVKKQVMYSPGSRSITALSL